MTTWYFFDDDAEDDEYEAFVEKFKPKKTTDDCYTPPIVYDAVAAWVTLEYALDAAQFVRPFWPGGDYQAFDYAPDAVVVDNPPFSMLASILRWFMARGIRFFLFAPTLTLLSRVDGVTHIACGVQITYANGAKVNTSFVTNLEPGDCVLRSAPTLYKAVRVADEINLAAQKKEMPKYKYPDNVLTAAAAYQYSHYGVDFRVNRADCTRISTIDAMKAAGRKDGIFGGALLLSERAAAERAAAERAAAMVWTLSEREMRIVHSLGEGARPVKKRL